MRGERRALAWVLTVVVAVSLGTASFGIGGAGAQVPPLPPPLGPPPPSEQPPPDRPPPERPPPQEKPPPPQPAPAPSSAYPPLPAGSGSGRRVVYANRAQRVWLVEQNEQVVRSYLVSGRRGIPRPGTYSVFSRSRVSTSGSLRLEYMVRFARGRTLHVGLHAIPVRRNGRPIQSESELGKYRSHGCVRQSRADARFLWDWAPLGTTVVVVR